jgi:hypothetical protein
MKNTAHSRLRSRRGVALAFVALILFVLLGMAALAVDFGILLGARTEAQRTADAAALAGASILLQDGTNEARARSTAIDFGALNRIRNESPVIEAGDVDVELDRGLVRVRVLRTADRGSAVPNIFARAIGFPTSNVTAVAAAIAGAGNQVRCPLPFALVDRFWDTNAGRLADWLKGFERSVPDRYVAGAREVAPPRPDARTGWSNLDRGTVWRIYPGSTTQTPTAGYFYPLALENPGANEYEAWIRGCARPNVPFRIGQAIDIEPGAMRGPTRSGFEDLLSGDDNEWNFSLNCPARPGASVCSTETDTRRIRPLLIISPLENALSQSGRQTVNIVNLAGVFVVCRGRLRPGVTPETLVRKEQCETVPAGQEQQNPDASGVWIRFMNIQGEIGPDADPNSNSLVRVLRLVE